jgi:hypothetical protein
MDRSGGVVAARAVDRGFNPWSRQTKDSANHAALRRKNKNWLSRNDNNMFVVRDMSIN